ncbi:MAG: LysM peptidoglycan-binding domain-containing protein [Chloroflexi bacterium]|nr:LysM peptidoglycan-binding domain-containing protein [Chloroflexota bacterium]
MRSDPSGKRSVSFVLVVLAAIALLAAIQWLRQRNAPLPTTAKLVVISGEAVIQRADAGTDPPLRAGGSTTLQRGDQVRVNAEGRARLTFSGGEVIELGADTHLAVLELHQAPLSRGLVVILALQQGKTLTRIRHMLFQGSRFVVETQVATVEARGTVFECDVLAKDRIYVAVHEGVVRVSMGEQSLELEAGQGVEARLGQPLTPIVVSAPLPGEIAQGTAAASPTGSPLVTEMPTFTDWQKTLFPPVLTPTRPGDAARPKAAPTVASEHYVVQAGDTLYSIARDLGVDWKALWEANKDILASPERIYPGQQLRIPAH